MLEAGKLSVGSVLICEAIRLEANNKLAVLGVFSGGIVFPELPARMPICAFVELSCNEIGPVSIDFRFTSPDGTSVSIRTEVELTDVGPFALPLPTMDLAINEIGRLKFDIRVDDKDWVALTEKEVLLSPPA